MGQDDVEKSAGICPETASPSQETISWPRADFTTGSVGCGGGTSSASISTTFSSDHSPGTLVCTPMARMRKRQVEPELKPPVRKNDSGLVSSSVQGCSSPNSGSGSASSMPHSSYCWIRAG